MDEPNPLGRNVFIPNVTWHNYTDAKRFGQLIQLTKGPIDQIDLDDIQDKITSKMVDFGLNAHDWILVSGAPILNIIAVTVMLERFDVVNLLQWNGILNTYQPFTLRGVRNAIASNSK